MLALVYLTLMTVFGDRLCRRFYRFVSLPHRFSASFLVGLIFSTWITYLCALLFAWTNEPLVWGNLLFFAVAGFAIFKLRSQAFESSSTVSLRPAGLPQWDYAFVGACGVFACWLMFGSIGMNEDKLRIASVPWADFGPNLSIVQSFAAGNNFPTEYPHFIGAPIRYHFLFWFQAGNLEFLGLNLAWSLNILSVASLVAVLLLIATLGETLFDSRAVGRIAAALLFFHGSLSYVPFLRAQSSVGEAVGSVVHLDHWLPSVYTYRGEAWGIWSLGVFYVQRHLLVGIGVFLLVLIYLSQRYREALRADKKRVKIAAGEHDGKTKNHKSSLRHRASAAPSTSALRRSMTTLLPKSSNSDTRSFIFSGLLIGVLPLWNSPAFAAAVVVLACLLFVIPDRRNLFYLLIVAALTSLPQILLLKSGGAEISGASSPSLLHWGYVVDDPTLWNVLKYFLFTFGLKLLLVIVALRYLPKVYAWLFLAASSTVALAFGTQLSPDMINNSKLLNIWLVVANLFVAYALWRIGQLKISGFKPIGLVAAVLLLLTIIPGGVIELFRVHNDNWTEVPFKEDRLITWLEAETKPREIFLSDRFVIHPILLAGRRIFYGWPYNGWSMGYPTRARDVVYKQMLTEQNPQELLRLLHDNNIAYVAFDNGVRQGEFKATQNEAVCQMYFKTVFTDTENRYGALVIYKVPDHIGETMYAH